MADNTTLNAASTAGDVISTEDIGGGVKLPRTKLVLGGHGTDGGDISTANPVPAQLSAAASGGATPYPTVVSAASNNATSAKATAGTLYRIVAANYNTSYATHVKFYDKATAPAPATDTPKLTIPIPKAADSATPTVIVITGQSEGTLFGSGIAFAIVQGKTTSDNTAVASGDVVLNFDYM